MTSANEASNVSLPSGIQEPARSGDNQPVSHLQRIDPESFMRVNENGIYEFDRVIKRGKVLYNKRNKKV